VAASAAAGAVGRWAVLWLMWAVPPVPHRDGLAKDVGQQLGWPELLIGSLLVVPGVAWAAATTPGRLAAGVVAAGVLTTCWGRRVRRRLGGVTGDCLGAGCYAAQLAGLLAASARL
jgi:adenosylcobinamide-GDP ribazoletransferase